MHVRGSLISRNRLPIVGLMLLIILVCALILTAFLSQHAQRIQQRAAGNAVYASPGDNLSNKVHSLSAGDTLILHDGLYSSSRLGIDGIHGTATSLLTIRAEHDGKAVLDGGGPHVIEVSNSAYVVIVGLVARNPDQGGVVDVEGSDHITLRRTSASNANPGNNHVFNIANGTTNTLVEDCAGYGRGRYIFIAYHATHITFRRTWAHWTDQEQFDAPRAAYSIYGSSNVTLENMIGLNAFPNQQDSSNNAYTAVYETSNGPPTDHVKYIGDMLYNNWDGLYLNAASGQDTQFIDSYLESPSQLSQTGYSANEHGNGLAWWNGNGGSIANSTFVNNEIGFNRANGASSPTLTNSVFFNNGKEIANVGEHRSIDFFGNASNGTSLNSTDRHVDPGYNVAKYGRGAYLFIPPKSPLKHAGQGGADMGAHIMYRYVDGV